MKRGFLFLLVIITVTLASCATIRVDLPEGFSLVGKWTRYTAVSPEGLKYQVRREENYPEKNVDFWSDALTRQMKEEGYNLRQEGVFFDCPAGRGFFIEWNVPYQGDTYVYLTAIVPCGKKIYIAEAAAENTIYKKYRDAILESLKSLSAK